MTAAAPVTGAYTVALDADPDAARAVLARADLAGPAARALRALAGVPRLPLAPSRLPGEAAVGAIWRLDGEPGPAVAPGAFDAFARAGHVKARWDVRVQPAAGGGALLSVASRVTGTDPAAHARMLEAWAVVGTLCDAFARRLARTLRAQAEADAG